MSLCRKIAAKCSKMQPFILLFPLLFPKKGRLPLYQVVDSFRPAMARAYKLAQVNMAYRRKLYSMSVNVSCFILPAPPLFCWYYYTIFRARMEVGIIQRSGENFFSSVCLTGSGSIKSQTQLYFLSVSHTDSSLNPIEEPPPYVFVTPA